MKPSELIKFVIARYKAGIQRSVHVKGAPGMGKTQIAGQIARELGIGVKFIHAPLMQPEDYALPVRAADGQSMQFLVSKDKFPFETSDCPAKGILLIDELPQADNSGQKILSNLLQEREIHGNRLKAGWHIISTGNRTTDRAGANRLLSHLGNKITQIELEPSIDDWTNWALDHGIRAELIAFIRFRPELLHAFDPHADVSPTPRAWSEGVSPMIGASEPLLEFESFKGDVGEAAAGEFLSFLQLCRKLPSVDAIVLNPAGSPVPKESETDVLYALCGALAHRAEVGNFGRIMNYVKRIPAEFGALFIHDVIRMHPEIQTTKDFIQYMTQTGHKILV